MKRWGHVFAVAMFINTSYGTLSYAFSVLISSDAAGGTFGARTVSLGFGAALLVSEIASLGAGTLADLFGSRRLMAGGSVLGAVALCLLAASREPWQAVLVLAFVAGPAMAATFYEPVYVLMNRWFAPLERPKAYGVLTLLSGFSITIYTPLTRWLVDAIGWREGHFRILVLRVDVRAPPGAVEGVERVVVDAVAGRAVLEEDRPDLALRRIDLRADGLAGELRRRGQGRHQQQKKKREACDLHGPRPFRAA